MASGKGGVPSVVVVKRELMADESVQVDCKKSIKLLDAAATSTGRADLQLPASPSPLFCSKDVPCLQCDSCNAILDDFYKNQQMMDAATLSALSCSPETGNDETVLRRSPSPPKTGTGDGGAVLSCRPPETETDGAVPSGNPEEGDQSTTVSASSYNLSASSDDELEAGEAVLSSSPPETGADGAVPSGSHGEETGEEGDQSTTVSASSYDSSASSDDEMDAGVECPLCGNFFNHGSLLREHAYKCRGNRYAARIEEWKKSQMFKKQEEESILEQGKYPSASISKADTTPAAQSVLCPKYEHGELSPSPSTVMSPGCAIQLKKPIECLKCKLQFQSEIQKKAHLRYACMAKEFHCKKCSLRFTTSELYFDHFAQNKCKVKKFACKNCSNRYARKRYFLTHQITCGKITEGKCFAPTPPVSPEVTDYRSQQQLIHDPSVFQQQLNYPKYMLPFQFYPSHQHHDQNYPLGSRFLFNEEAPKDQLPSFPLAQDKEAPTNTSPFSQNKPVDLSSKSYYHASPQGRYFPSNPTQEQCPPIPLDLCYQQGPREKFPLSQNEPYYAYGSNQNP